MYELWCHFHDIHRGSFNRVKTRSNCSLLTKGLLLQEQKYNSTNMHLILLPLLLFTTLLVDQSDCFVTQLPECGRYRGNFSVRHDDKYFEVRRIQINFLVSIIFALLVRVGRSAFFFFFFTFNLSYVRKCSDNLMMIGI